MLQSLRHKSLHPTGPGLVLVTGFEPFGKVGFNISGEIAANFHGTQVSGWQIHGAVLPVSYRRAEEKIMALLEQQAWDAIICLGVNAKQKVPIQFEHEAGNLIASPFPDVDQEMLQGMEIRTGARDKYHSTISVPEMQKYLGCIGVQSTGSFDAGGYVCNFLYYLVLHYLYQGRKEVPATFLHLPYCQRSSEGKGSYLHYVIRYLIGKLGGDRDREFSKIENMANHLRFENAGLAPQ